MVPSCDAGPFRPGTHCIETPPTLYIVSANPAVATASPQSSSGMFTVTEARAGSTTLTITDNGGNTISVPVTVK
jgi:hypothetical protein